MSSEKLGSVLWFLKKFLGRVGEHLCFSLVLDYLEVVISPCFLMLHSTSCLQPMATVSSCMDENSEKFISSGFSSSAKKLSSLDLRW